MIVVSKVLRCLAAVPLILALSNRAIGADVDSSYSAEVYRSEGFLTGRQRLLVFPLGGDAVTIPLPIPLGWVEYNASGTALYVKTIQQSLPGSRAVSPGAQSGTVAPGLFKIEFNPIRVSLVPGSADFLELRGFVVSPREDKIVLAGLRLEGRQYACGLFDLAMPKGEPRRAFDKATCWSPDSLSPDGQTGVGNSGWDLVLVDFATNTTRPLTTGERLTRSRWSPDGKWISAARHESPRIRTVLIDPSDPSRRRELGGTNDGEGVIWSPDSRYLLHITRQSGSECKFAGPGAGIGWLSTTIALTAR